jgi:ERCC4-type nuclease
MSYSKTENIKRHPEKNEQKNILDVNIIIDTREKRPWEFKSVPSGMNINNIYHDKLDAGDYCLLGLEFPEQDFSVIIERKAKMEEFLGNIGYNWKRFKRELEKLSEFERPAIIVEDDMSKAYARYKSSRGRRRGYFNLPPEFIIKRISEIYIDYGVPVFFASSRSMGERFALNFFKHATKMEDSLDDE